MSLRRPALVTSAKTANWLQTVKRPQNALLRTVARRTSTTKGRGRLVCNALEMSDFDFIPKWLVFLRPEFSAFVILLGVYINIDKIRNKENPRKDSQKEWKMQEKALRERNVRSITAFEAKSFIDNKGYLLVDVRKEEDFAKRHARGSINVPLFVDRKTFSVSSSLKSLLLFTQGLKATEENMEFAKLVKAAQSEGQGIILVDESPLGTLNRTLNRATGTQCRALIAAYLLLSEMDESIDILHLDGGTNAMYKEGFPQEPRPGLSGNDNDTDNSSRMW